MYVFIDRKSELLTNHYSFLENGCKIDYLCNKNKEMLVYLTVNAHKSQFVVEGQNPTITQLIEYID